ncbi:hypothetical protein BJY21_000983 [Kineosphaera limosa]|uniref:Uncharacterized protein n=1 Tax=Kineosphaera limosa NBRC 100340 TaxID=1184609 RepID=K6VNV9_9MICO|nr:hypothetical protein [Kineosphaera limosa]NYD99798.1 hypothetical protein [Kineosphaera limosa]GAB97888.1 hypothetical protein KILIM_086_00140 [Kineosphaera limosa NBRC 100340]
MRTFITKIDIDERLARGESELVCPPDVTITDLAAEYARSRGMAVRRVEAAGVAAAGEGAVDPQVRAKVRSAVLAQLGHVPPGLDEAIDRVLRGS